MTTVIPPLCKGSCKDTHKRNNGKERPLLFGLVLRTPGRAPETDTLHVSTSLRISQVNLFWYPLVNFIFLFPVCLYLSASETNFICSKKKKKKVYFQALFRLIVDVSADKKDKNPYPPGVCILVYFWRMCWDITIEMYLSQTKFLISNGHLILVFPLVSLALVFSHLFFMYIYKLISFFSNISLTLYDSCYIVSLFCPLLSLSVTDPNPNPYCCWWFRTSAQ